MALLTLQSYFETTTSIVLAQNYKEACKKLNQTAYQYFETIFTLVAETRFIIPQTNIISKSVLAKAIFS